MPPWRDCVGWRFDGVCDGENCVGWRVIQVVEGVRWLEKTESENFPRMFSGFKFLIGLVVIVIAGFFCFLQFADSGGLVVLSAASSSSETDGLSEILHLEAVIRNITNATTEQIGSVYADCKNKDLPTGSVLLREFGNNTKELWLILQLNPERTVSSGLIKVKVFYNSNKLMSTHYNLCKKFLPSIKCPLAPQRQTYGLRYPLPRFALPGKYGIEARVVDQKDMTLACVISELSL
ncbi:hypothetical protein BV898_14301 [Hypsibius exemplaris]|uniref:MD-2-related lipid-recognition domain-containing protein n=1 Tax=Hypsibius exemplaris TaxID=2072580 RepID=A0A1W0W890_HYPEX|nr:hypothetical protein BV898_14301 [Hypsibius exemplaris]